MNKNTKTILWVAGSVIVLALIIGAIWHAHRKAQLAMENQGGSPTLNDLVSGNASTTTSTSPSLPRTGKGSAAYTQAIATYKYRLQFSQCHGVDNNVGNGTLAIHKGDKLMLDNRDPVGHTFAFKGVSVKVAGDSYAIVTPYILGTYPLTCDGGGAAQLMVE